jgi:hypothetical protein
MKLQIQKKLREVRPERLKVGFPPFENLWYECHTNMRDHAESKEPTDFDSRYSSIR